MVAGTPGPPPPPPESIAEAWRLADPTGEGLSLSKVAERLNISRSTAGEWVKRGREQRAWLEVLNRAEQQVDMAGRYGGYLRVALAKLDEAENVTEWVAVFNAVLKAEAQLANLLGLNAPTRVNVGADNGKAEPDIGVLQAFRRAEAAARADEASLRAGGRGVIEGSG